MNLSDLNSATKYPSIPTYHVQVKGRLTEDVAVPFDGPVHVTEKVDGCLASTTKIWMADGSRRAISRLSVGEEVLGVDGHGAVVPAKVLRTFNNGAAKRWLRVIGKRRAAGRGPTHFAVQCTPDHRFWNPSTSSFVAAADLRPGSSVAVVRSDLDLSPLQEQVLLGKMLGDGTFHDTTWSAAVQWSQAKSDLGYIEWTERALGSLARPSRGSRVSGYGTEMVSGGTVFTLAIKKLFGDFHTSKVKSIPPWVAEKLGPIALAFWYMDDGSLGQSEGQEDRAHFAVCGFTAADCNVLIGALARLGITAHAYQSKGYWNLRLNATDAERLFLLVAPYVPPCMQRKLPARYRGHEGWLPAVGTQHKPSLVTQEVVEVTEEGVVPSHRYDIETSTHNYFAGGVLVHNCNGRIVLLPGGDYFLGSREELIYAKGDRIETPMLGIVAALKPIAKRLAVEAPPAQGAVVYFGEVYGGDLPAARQYTSTKQLGFRLFDVIVYDEQQLAEVLVMEPSRRASWREQCNQPFLWVGALAELSTMVRLPLVPEVGVCSSGLPTTLAGVWELLQQAAGRTACALDGEGGRAEGLVLRSLDGRRIAKVRVEDYWRAIRGAGR